MKYILLLLFVSSIFLNAEQVQENKQLEKKELIKNKNIQDQLKLEKKYSKEQRFYQGSEYDLKSLEVNKESVKNLPNVENRNSDFDMDNVYD